MNIYSIFKRIIDVVLSLLAIIILSPLLIVISIIIKIDSPGPVFFKQRRIGKNKKEFYILKFRTMRTDTPKDTPTHLFKNSDDYITSIGRFLRGTSLDELPQLVNIIKGEMSIIGPRPALWNQFDLTEQRDKYDVHSVLPGLTGLAQINGRDAIDIKDKAYYDGEYVKNYGFIIDFKIFFKTIVFVLKKKDVVEGEHAVIVKENNVVNDMNLAEAEVAAGKEKSYKGIQEGVIN